MVVIIHVYAFIVTTYSSPFVFDASNMVFYFWVARALDPASDLFLVPPGAGMRLSLVFPARHFVFAFL